MTVVIGIDCAADPKNVGLATASLEGDHARVMHAELATKDLVARIAGWIPPGTPALLALDAPLGWPVALGAELGSHTAGGRLVATAHAMFRRRTDDVVHARTGKRPLDIGADRIARCTHAALGLLESLRRATGVEIPLAWEPGPPRTTSAIEVYPAATLASRRHAATGYKRAKDPDAVDARRRLTQLLGRELDLSPEVREEMARVDHVFDAVVCVLAALDFVRADVIFPPSDPAILREGWIWVRPRADAIVDPA